MMPDFTSGALQARRESQTLEFIWCIFRRVVGFDSDESAVFDGPERILTFFAIHDKEPVGASPVTIVKLTDPTSLLPKAQMTAMLDEDGSLLLVADNSKPFDPVLVVHGERDVDGQRKVSILPGIRTGRDDKLISFAGLCTSAEGAVAEQIMSG